MLVEFTIYKNFINYLQNKQHFMFEYKNKILLLGNLLYNIINEHRSSKVFQ